MEKEIKKQMEEDKQTDILESEENSQETVEKKDYDGIKFSVKVHEKDMVDFVMHHSYSSISGWIGVVLSVAAIIYLIVGFNQFDNLVRGALIVIGLLFTVINPIMLYFKAKKQVRVNKMFENPVDYILNEKYLVIEQNQEQLAMPWENLYIVKETGRSLIVYVTRMRAFIWSKEQLGSLQEEIKSTLLDKMGSARVRLKNKK